jgi:hypothetical protein
MDLEFNSVSFEFEGNNYLSLIRKKQKGNTTQYCITIMNGELEKLLFGNHVITEVDGVLQIDNAITDPRQAALKMAVSRALYKFLHAQREKNHELPVQASR